MRLKELRISWNPWLERVALGLATLFVLTSLQRFWIHPSGGHVHRQAVTLGMSVEFAEELRTRGFSALDFLIYPRVLEHGLKDGVNASEFPVLNFVTGFLFLPFADPRIGVVLTSLLILLLNLYTAWFCLPRILRAWKVDAPPALCLALWFACGTIASQSNTAMPEGVAFPLVLLGMERLIGGTHLWKIALGTLLCSLGVAVKPTAVIALGAAAVLPFLSDQHRTRWRPILAGLGTSLLFPGWWYGVHCKHILATFQGPQVFALAQFDPLLRLRELGLGGLASLLWREPLTGQLPMWVGWFFVIAAFALGEWACAALYLLSLVAAASLDGLHIFAHGYYFIGASIFALILMARVLGAFDRRRVLRAVSLVLIFWGVLFTVRVNFWVWARDSRLWEVDPWRMGAEVRAMIPPSHHLITDDGGVPLKLLLIGRSGTAAGGAGYSICNEPAYQALKLAIVSDAPPPATSPPCQGGVAEIRSVSTPYGTWYVSLIQ